MASILVVGSVALDTISNSFGKIEEGLGGSAVYFSLAATPFSQIHVVAVVGQDFPQDHKDLLVRKGVDLEGLITDKGKTFRWIGEYSQDLNTAKTLDTQLNVFENFSPVIPKEYKTISTVFLANIDPTLQLNVLSQIDKPQLIACDTMNFWIENKRDEVLDVLAHVHLLLINEDEANMLSEKHSLVESAKFILDHGPQTVVIKRGAAGVTMFHSDQIFTAPVYCATQAIDTTGAGDSFAGGFLGYLSRTQDHSWLHLKRAAIVGTIIASFNIESFSIHRLHLLKAYEIQERWEHFAQITAFNSEPQLFTV